MKRKRFSEEQIIAILREHEAGVATADLCRKHGMSNASLPPSAVKALRAHRIAQMKQSLALGLGKLPDDALVFGQLDGAPMSPDNLSRDWRRTCRRLGLPLVSFHALRHTHASALIAAGLDVVTISRRLGHTNPTVTLNTYAHLFRQTDSVAAAAIERVLAGTREHQRTRGE